MDDGVISADEAGRNFDRLLAQVEAGQSLTITRDGRPVAMGTPVADAEPETPSAHDGLMGLLRQGLPLDFHGGIDREELHRR